MTKDTQQRKCFVCKEIINEDQIKHNRKVNLPICSNCQGTEMEKQAEQEAIDSLGEDFVCGCI